MPRTLKEKNNEFWNGIYLQLIDISRVRMTLNKTFLEKRNIYFIITKLDTIVF